MNNENTKDPMLQRHPFAGFVAMSADVERVKGWMAAINAAGRECYEGEEPKNTLEDLHRELGVALSDANMADALRD